MLDSYYFAAILAFQAPFICLIISIYYIITLGRNGYTRTQHVMARLLGVTCLLSMAAEINNGLVLYIFFDRVGADTYMKTCTIGYVTMLLSAILWSEFCLSRTHNPSRFWSFIIRLLYFVTFVLITARIAFSHTKLFIYYEDGEFKYGPLDDLQTYCCILIYFILLLVLIGKCCDRNEYAEREKHGKLVFANSIVFIAIVIYGTIFFPYVVWIGQMLVLLYVYMQSQRSSIYHDELTHLNNRRLMIKNISDKIRNENPWSLIMLDINSFKSINDNYGHSEGDNALIEVAAVLDLLSRENGYTAYRYGGDEFTVLLNTNDEEKIASFCKELDERMERRNEENKAPYALQLSSGYAIYDEENMASIPDVIESADEKMYEDKKRKKSMLATEEVTE